MRKFVYAARLVQDRKDGGYVVTFRDIPEAVTQGDTVEAALEEASGALQAAIEARIMDGMDIPSPSVSKRGERLVPVPVQTALKAALYLEMRSAGISRVGLARRLGMDEKEARRMLDPRHPSKADRLERALAVLGRHAEIRVA
ncbi:MAG: type II toxin-antitoxin system HicB family antitoxin [Nitrospirae bacterium]|nr:type II toxin-antitoxin system HicB family antitoxin [Nitrospirota bacterium]